MFWVVQENLHGERGFDSLIETFEKMKIEHALVKVVPFVGEIIPDINPPNPVMVIGSMSMHHVAEKKGWSPGVFLIPGYHSWFTHWPFHLLNDDHLICKIKDVRKKDLPKGDVFFIRPTEDTKTFNGGLQDWDEFSEWRKRLKAISSENPTCSLDTVIMASVWKQIYKEFRFFVVDGKVVSGSIYKMGGKVTYISEVDNEVYDFAQARVNEWQPARAFVIDISLTDRGYKIIECNNLNSCGFYATNIPKLVDAIENMEL